MLNWRLQTFQQLSLTALYELLALRQAVFVVEQNCPYQDADGEDSAALHLMGWEGQELVAYARIFHASEQPHNNNSAASHGAERNCHRIGRVIVAPQARGKQLGRELMERAIAEAFAGNPGLDIVIGAQCYLLDFYRSLGFVCEGQEYLEDGIPHQDMRLTPKAAAHYD